MRIVLRGTKKKLYRLRKCDLPKDGSLQGSFLKWVDLSGFDLLGYDCQWVDIHDSNCQKVILPERIEFMVSLRSDWTDAYLPKAVSFCGGLVREVLRRHTAPPGSRAEAMVNFVLSALSVREEHYDVWQVAVHHFRTVMNLTDEEQCETWERYVFGGYPDLMAATRRYLTAAIKEPKPLWPRDQRFGGPKGEPVVVPANVITPFATEDRWAAARMLEQYLGDGWEAHYFMLTGIPWVVAMHENIARGAGEWWRRAWPS